MITRMDYIYCCLNTNTGTCGAAALNNNGTCDTDAVAYL